LPLFSLSSSTGGSQHSSFAPKIVENPIRFRSQSFAEEDFFLNKEKSTAILIGLRAFLTPYRGKTALQNRVQICAVRLDRGGLGSALIALPVSIIFTSQFEFTENLQQNSAYRRTKRRYAPSVYYNFVQALASEGNETALNHTLRSM